MSNRGLDIGTNMLVAGFTDDDGNPIFKMQRDAFYRIVPKSEVNRNSIRVSLEKRGANFIVDNDGTFIVVGEDALEIAIERNDVAQRPLHRGVVSPKEKDSMPMLKHIIENLIGPGGKGDKVIFSVPARPVDNNFDIVYHKEMMKMYLEKLGYDAYPINEAFAVGLSELLEDGLTGICLSYGAGMTNTAVLHEGDPLVEFSVTQAGDFIDNAVGTALDISPSLVQLEKEAGVDLNNPQTKLLEAVSIYYDIVIKYTLENIAHEIKVREKSMPVFKNQIPIIVSGGLTKAEGFVQRVENIVSSMEFPIRVSEVRRAENPMTAVANGCFLASQL